MKVVYGLLVLFALFVFREELGDLVSPHGALPPGYTLLTDGTRFSFKDGDGWSVWSEARGYSTKQGAINAAWHEHNHYLRNPPINWSEAK
ncbi:MAG: hypothetical protein V4563_14035 [Pseudomonadota bacterium]